MSLGLLGLYQLPIQEELREKTSKEVAAVKSTDTNWLVLQSLCPERAPWDTGCSDSACKHPGGNGELICSILGIQLLPQQEGRTQLSWLGGWAEDAVTCTCMSVCVHTGACMGRTGVWAGLRSKAGERKPSISTFSHRSAQAFEDTQATSRPSFQDSSGQPGREARSAHICPHRAAEIVLLFPMRG